MYIHVFSGDEFITEFEILLENAGDAEIIKVELNQILSSSETLDCELLLNLLAEFNISLGKKNLFGI